MSALVLAVILSRVSLRQLLDRAAAGSPLYLFPALGLAVLSFAAVALRWRLVARCLGVAMSMGLAVRAQFVAMFGGQVLPSGVGVDVMRAWVLARRAGDTPRVVASLVADRLVALCAASLLALPALSGLLGPGALAGLVGAPWLASLLGPAVVAVAVGVLATFLFAIRRLNGVELRPGPLASAMAAALAIHVTVVVMAALSAHAYGVRSDLSLWFEVIPTSIIVTSIPVSLNGWGVREAAIVVLTTPLGIPAEEALLVSMTLGALNAVASLPGALVLLRARGREVA